MVKKLTALLFGALFITGAALAEKAATADEVVSSKETKSKRYSRNRKSNGNGNKGAYVAETTVVEETSRYNGGSCSTGSCRAKSCNTCNTRRHSHGHSHACKDTNCGHCRRAELPPKPCCEKAVTVYTEPCLHKQIEYSWTCPVEYTATNCPSNC